MKLGIYGGTFNPIHYGHLRTAEEVMEMLSLDRILFIPSGRPPFDKPRLAGAGHRYKMVRAAIEGNPWFKISGIEMDTKGAAYTIDTIRRLKKRYGRSDLYFILGIDAFLDLPKWKTPDKLIGMTNLVIISRPGYSFTDLSKLSYLKNIPLKLLKELDRGKRDQLQFKLSERTAGILCNVTELEISASHIRSLIMSGNNINYLLPDSVKSYIFSNKLYVK